ncbi:MAG: hypothetical protein ABDH21_03830 [bacterium]
MDEFWINRINLLQTKLEDEDIGYLYEVGVRDLALFYRTYFDDEVFKNILENILNLLFQTQNSLIHLAIIHLLSELAFIQITEFEEYYKEKAKSMITEITSKISKVKTSIEKEYPQEYFLYSSIYSAIASFLGGNTKAMENTLLKAQKSYPDNPKVNLLLALAKTKTSSTIYKVSLIEVIKTSPNNLEKAIAQELVGDISELLQSISWYEDCENIYTELGLYRDLLRLYYKKIEKLKTDQTKKIQLAQDYVKISNILLKLGEKQQAKKYLLESFNILLQLNSYIEIIEIIKKNNILEAFPDSINEFEDIIIKTFEKRISIDPYNVNLYLEFANWLGTLSLTSKQETTLVTAYQICIEKRLNDKMIIVAKNLLSINPNNPEYISMYVESLIANQVSEQEIAEYITQKMQELKDQGKQQEYTFLIEKFQTLIPLQKIQTIEKEQLIEKINTITNPNQKINLIREYISKYPDDHEISHKYIITLYTSNQNKAETYKLLLQSLEWYKDNIHKLDPNEIEIIYNILLENQDFENLRRII